MTPVAGANIHHKPQAWRAYKRILQHAQTRGLGRGDRLPTQPELCRELGLCTNTLRAAMEALVEDGTLTSKQRVGTVIVNPAAIERVPWTIGIAPPLGVSMEQYAFGAALMMQVQVALTKANCHCFLVQLTPHRTPLQVGPTGVGPLQTDVDGMILLQSPGTPAWHEMTREGTALSHTHWWEQAPHGIVVDQAAFAEGAVAQLRARGCKTFAAATSCDRWHMATRFWDGFDKAVAAAGLPREAGETLVISQNEVRVPIDEIAPRFAQELLARRPQQRPDAIVIADDYVAAQLAFILRESSNYRPAMAVQVNKQPPQLFALPVLAYEVDSERLATRAASLLLERVRNPAIRERLEWHVPSLSRPDPRSYPATWMASNNPAGVDPANTRGVRHV